MRAIPQKYRALAVLLAGILLLSGCAALGTQNVNDLLRAPALGQGQGAVQEALAAYLGEVPEYKYPKEGDWRSPLLLADLDGNGTEEGLLLYSMANSASTEKSGNVYIAVLQQAEGEWTVVQDVEGGNTEVASLEVVDILGGGPKQLFIGFASANLSNKSLTIYRYENSVLTPEAPIAYSRYELGDFTGSGQTELVLVSQTETVDAMHLRYVPVRDGAFDFSQQPAQLNSNAKNCMGIYPSRNLEGTRFLVLDALNDTQMLFSQIFAYSEENGLFYTHEDYNALMGVSSRVNQLLTSRDIDEDGIVETPVRVGMTPIVTQKDNKHLEYVEWMDFLESEPVSKQFGIVDSEKSVYIRLPEEWRDTIRVEDGAGRGEWTLQNQFTRKTLLTVRVLSAGETPPVDAVNVSLASGAYLLFGSGVSAAQRQVVRVFPLG